MTVRILYFADIRFPLERANGIQTMETCHALADRGHSVELIVRRDSHQPARDPFAYYGLPQTTNLIVERARVTGPAVSKRLGYLAFAAGRAFGSSRADAIVTRDLGVASMLLRIPRSMRPPLVYESHGYAPEVAAALPELVAAAGHPTERKLQRLALREARVWRGADGYVTITKGLADELIARFGNRPRIAVVPDGVRIRPCTGYVRPKSVPRESHTARASDYVTKAEHVETGRPIVAYAGHLYAWKGVDVLLEALALVPEADGLIIGGYEEEPDIARLKGLAARLKIADRVTFTGLVPPPQVPDLLVRAQVLALPNPASAISTRYTSPLKLFEYMAAGRAIVASDLPSIREVLQHNVHALLVAPGDPHALAAGIRRLLEDPVLAARLGVAACEAVAHYGWQRRAERLEALLLEVTGPRG